MLHIVTLQIIFTCFCFSSTRVQPRSQIICIIFFEATENFLSEVCTAINDAIETHYTCKAFQSILKSRKLAWCKQTKRFSEFFNSSLGTKRWVNNKECRCKFKFNPLEYTLLIQRTLTSNRKSSVIHSFMQSHQKFSTMSIFLRSTKWNLGSEKKWMKEKHLDLLVQNFV